MKKKMRKPISVLIIGTIFLLIVGIFATAENFDFQDKEFVKNFIEKRGIKSENIKNISKVNFDDLPKEVNIENVNEANLAIYEIDYEENAENKEIFVVTYSTEKLESQKDLIFSQDKRELLNFGFVGESSESKFLNTATGVETDSERGYVMMRRGSITGISTSLEVVEGEGKIEIIIYKNGEAIGFGNTIIADSSGIKKDFDIQSKGIVSFEPGDVISAYIKIEGNVTWKEVITLVEITVN